MKLITKGQKINDRYEVIKSIGEGGMANVYLAKDTILDRKVAVKVLRGDLANDEKFVRRFQREALSASSLSHPNIVEMYDVGEDEGNHYIVMEYVEGKTLKQLLKKRGNLTVSEAVDIMLQLADGIAHAHDSYIIHRDIKPQNILIQEDGQIKITDFGIAMALNSTQLTQTNSVMGSVHYLPPEQANGKGSTIKCDIYSMGILFYELLTGVLPFKGDNAVEIALKHMKDPIPSVRKQNSNIPQSIENIILKSTAKNPKNRYNDVKEMYQDLKTCLDPDVMDQPRYVYKYPEHETEDKEQIPTIRPKKKEVEKKREPIKEEQKEEEEIVEELEDDEEPKNSKKMNIIIWSLFGILVALVGVVSAIFLPSFFGKEKEIEIPDVSGMSVVDAESVLRDSGFEVKPETEKMASAEYEVGQVVKTDPIAGRTVKEGTEITLYESIGEETYTVEYFTGEKIDVIQERLRPYGITVETKSKSIEGVEAIDGIDDMESLDKETIIDQDPKEGTVLKKGDKVTLYYPEIYNKYPDFVNEGWTLEEVKEFCEQYSVTVKVQETVSQIKEPGTILRQSRPAGSEIVENAEIIITIAKKEEVQNTPPATGSDDNTDQNDSSSTDGTTQSP